MMNRPESAARSGSPIFDWQRVYAPDLILEAHAHAEPRLCVVLGGSFDENGGDGWQTYRPGTLLYRPGGYFHEERFGATGAACAVFELGPELSGIAPEDFDAETPRSSSSAVHIAAGLRLEVQQRDPFSAAACQSLLWQAVILLGRGERDGGRAAGAAQQAAEVIEARFRQGISLSSVATALSVPPSTLARTFAQVFGMSVGDFVQRRRCDEAAMLLGGAMPIAEIALECGFSSQAHLTAAFRRYKGKTPARFRRSHYS